MIEASFVSHALLQEHWHNIGNRTKLSSYICTLGCRETRNCWL